MFTPEWFQNKENVTFFIAVISFVFSVYNFISSFLQNLHRFTVEIPDAFRYQNEEKCIDLIRVKIFNHSKSSITIRQLTIIGKSGKNHFGNYSRVLETISRHRKKELISQTEIVSDTLPVKIEESGYVDLLLINDVDRKAIDLKFPHLILIRTTSGFTIRIKRFVSFSERQLSECRALNWK